MRYVLLAFGLTGGALVVAASARYAYLTTDTPEDGLLTAALFALVAAAGVGGHAVAVRTWNESRLWACFIGLVSVAAMLISLTNSLGFIALRGSTSQEAVAEGNRKAKQLEAELRRLVMERTALTLSPTTAGQVQAAKDAVTAAERDRVAECAKRGDRCREREGDARRARERLVEVEGHRATTLAAERLDAEIEATKTALASVGPRRSEDVHGRALATIFRLPVEAASYVATWQQAAFAAIFELVIVASLVAAELLTPRRTASVHAEPPRERQDETAEASAEHSAAAIASPPTPLLETSTSPSAPIGNPSKFFGQCIERDLDAVVPVSATLKAYRNWCRRGDLSPVDMATYAKAVGLIAEKIEVEIAEQDGRMVLVGLRLAEAEVVA